MAHPQKLHTARAAPSNIHEGEPEADTLRAIRPAAKAVAPSVRGDGPAGAVKGTCNCVSFTFTSIGLVRSIYRRVRMLVVNGKRIAPHPTGTHLWRTSETIPVRGDNDGSFHRLRGEHGPAGWCRRRSTSRWRDNTGASDR